MRYLPICLGVLSIAGAWAQPSDLPSGDRYLDESNGRTVSDLVDLALSGNQDVLATRTRIDEARGISTQAALRPNPGLTIQEREGSILGSPGERVILLGYTHTFELGGKRDRRIEAADIAQQLAGLEIADRERLASYDVRAQFGEALAAIRDLSTTEQLLQLNQQAHELSQARVEQGEAAELEERLLAVEVNRSKSDQIRMRNRVETVLAVLKRLAGLDLDAPLTIAGRLDAAVIDLSLEGALEQALAQRPDFLATRLREQLGEAEIRLAEAEGVPNLQGSIGYARSRSRFDQFGLSSQGQPVPLRDVDNSLSASISINLPFRNRNQGNIEAAIARKSAAELRTRYLEQVIRQEVRTAYRRYQTARDALDTFDLGVVAASLENLEVVRAAYQLGELRILDVLTQQQRYLDDQRSYTELLAEYYQSIVELDRSMGGGVF